jgi:hypothetical protein
MVRRFLRLAVILLVALAVGPGCGDSSAGPSKKTPVPDPEGGAVPKPAGAKGG